MLLFYFIISGCLGKPGHPTGCRFRNRLSCLLPERTRWRWCWKHRVLLQLLLFHRCRYCCCCCCYSLSMTRRRPDCRGIHRTWDVTTASSNYLLFSFRHLPNLQRHKLLSTVCANFLSYLEFMCVRQFKRVLHIMYTFSYASSLVSKKDSLPYRVAKMFSFVVQFNRNSFS